jgi:hypothetical protein
MRRRRDLYQRVVDHRLVEYRNGILPFLDQLTCKNCTAKLLKPLRDSFLTVLWALGDAGCPETASQNAGSGTDGTAQCRMLEKTLESRASQESPDIDPRCRACTWIRSGSRCGSSEHGVAKRHAYLNELCLTELACFVAMGRVLESNFSRDEFTIRTNFLNTLPTERCLEIDEAQGNYHERLCALTEVTIRSGPWFISLYDDPEQQDMVNDILSLEVRTMRAWETAGGPDRTSPCLWLGVKSILATRLNSDLDEMWPAVCRLVEKKLAPRSNLGPAIVSPVVSQAVSPVVSQAEEPASSEHDNVSS